MRRFWKTGPQERRPLISCCSVSISISCCSLPAAIGLALTALLIWLGVRFGQAERHTRTLGSPPR